MGEIKLGAEFNWGPVKTGMEQMRAFVGQTTAGIQKEIAGMLTPTGIGGFLSVAFLEQGITKIVQYASKIFDLGQRFAVSTTALQQFAGAAEKNGVSLDNVALAFNRLDIASSKALGGNKS